MDDNTTVEPLARPLATGRPRSRGRRALAAGALLMAVAATVGGCGSGGGKTAAASAGSATPVVPSASATASATAPGSPSASAPPSSYAPPGPVPGGSLPPAVPTPAPTGAPTQPGAPTTAPGSSGATPPEDPTDPRAQLKPLSYLISGGHLTVYFFGGVCDTYGLKADESRAGQVGVRVIVTQRPPVGHLCPALAKREAVAADLAQPLQGRIVVNLDTGADIPLESVPNGGPVSAGN